MCEWQKQIQTFVNETDSCVKNYHDEALILRALSRHLGYSEFYTTRKFQEISGVTLRDYVRCRKLAFALKEVQDSERSMLDIVFDYGFSSHEALTQASKDACGTAPSGCRKHPRSVVLHTKLSSLDRCFLGSREIGIMKSTDDIKIYFVTIPAYKFLHIRNYESNGYWDFRQKQSQTPEQDYETICGLLDSIRGGLDDYGGSESNSGGGQVTVYISGPNGRLCDWGLPRVECYDIRFPADYAGEIPPQMQMMDVLEIGYLISEHGPFDYEQEDRSIEELVEKVISEFDFTDIGCCYDTTPDKVIYFYHNPERFWKYVRPIRK